MKVASRDMCQRLGGAWAQGSFLKDSCLQSRLEPERHDLGFEPTEGCARNRTPSQSGEAAGSGGQSRAPQPSPRGADATSGEDALRSLAPGTLRKRASVQGVIRGLRDRDE